MNAESTAAPLDVAGKVLAVLCLATFWFIPFSPIMAIAAVATTCRTPGWPQRLAQTGAVLSIVWTAIVAALFLQLLLAAGLRG